MLLIFSRHSNSSEQVLREVQLAVDSHVPIVRVRIEDIPLSDDLRYYLSTPHWLDALSHPVSKHIPAVASAITELLGQSTDEEKTPAEVRPKPRAPLSEKKPGPSWKRISIGAVVLIAAILIVLWTLRSPSKMEVRVPATPLPTPQQTAPPIVVPSPSPVYSSTPVDEISRVLTDPDYRERLHQKSSSPSPTATAEPPSPTPVASPSPTESNKKAPVPRNDRAWQVWIDEFVHNFIASNETNDVDLAISFYGATVDLFEEGRKSVDAIRQDIVAYNARWPSRRATIRGDVRLSEKARNHSYTASFEHDYYVENPGRGEWINGAVAVDLQITVDSDGVPRINSMKQRTLRKDKGTMQKR